MVPSPRSRQSESETLDAADEVDNVDTHAQLEQQGRPASSSIVLYREPDGDEDEDEQLFIETIRRGTLAVQQRRRRLLSRPALTPAGDAQNDSVSDQLNSLSAGALSMPPLSQRSPGPRLQPEMLLPISLLSTTRTRRLSQVQATSSNTSAASFWLLYCAPPASTSDALTNKGPVFVQSALIARDGLGGGGCGRLVCARGQLSTDDDPGTYRSDAPPSHQALDWLDVILPQDDHHHWPHSCDCIQATLGCRNW